MIKRIDRLVLEYDKHIFDSTSIEESVLHEIRRKASMELLDQLLKEDGYTVIRVRMDRIPTMDYIEINFKAELIPTASKLVLVPNYVVMGKWRTIRYAICWLWDYINGYKL